MPTADCKVVVLGATGNQGGAVVRHLRRAGFSDVHALVRTAESQQAVSLSDQSVTLEIGDLDAPPTLAEAMRGAHGVFCALPLDDGGAESEIRRGRNTADAAKRAGVSHFVYSSTGGADRSDGVPHFQTKHVIEQYIRELGLPATIVRPATFMENFTTFEHPRLLDGVAVFRVAISATIRRQMIAVEDIGMIVADVFARPGTFLDATLEIAGDELTGGEIAETYERVIGQPARYEEQPIEEVRAFNPDFAAMFTWLSQHSFVADLAQLRSDYPDLTSLATWLERNRSAVEAR